MINRFQRKAQQKAQTDKRLGRKQGIAIVEWMRKQDELKRQNTAAESGLVEDPTETKDRGGEGQTP